MLADVNSKDVVFLAFVIGVPANRNIQAFVSQVLDRFRPQPLPTQCGVREVQDGPMDSQDSAS